MCTFKDECLVLRHRRPVSYPFPNPYSHPLPRFTFKGETGEILVTFATDPTYPVPPNKPDAPNEWKDKTYYLTSIPLRKPRTLIDNASEAIVNAFTVPLAFLSGRRLSSEATPEAVFTSGDFDLKEDEILENERSEEGEVDDSPEKIRRVRVIGLSKDDKRLSVEKAKLRRQWQILPLRSTKNRTGTI